MTKSELIRVLKHTPEINIRSILEGLSNQENIKIEINSNEIDDIRKILIILIEEDDSYFEKIKTIWDRGSNRSIDVSIDIDNTTTVVLVLGNIILNFMKAKYPNIVKTDSKYIERGYSSIADIFKSISKIIKTKDNEKD